MRHVLLAYCSRHGTTRRAGELIAASLTDDRIQFCDLSKDPFPALESIDLVIIGASVHGGFVQWEVRRELAKNLPQLLRKEVGLYLCYMDEKRAVENFERAFPEKLRLKARAKGLFGGALIFEKMSWLDRLVVSRFTHYHENVDHLKMHEIQKFAELLKTGIPELVS